MCDHVAARSSSQTHANAIRVPSASIMDDDTRGSRKGCGLACLSKSRGAEPADRRIRTVSAAPRWSPSDTRAPQDPNPPSDQSLQIRADVLADSLMC